MRGKVVYSVYSNQKMVSSYLIINTNNNYYNKNKSRIKKVINKVERMRVIGKFEVEVDIAGCGGDVFHEIFSTRPHHIATMSPSNIHGCDVHEGDYGKPGSIIFWDYTLDGKKCVAKELIEVVDEKNKLVRFKIIDGDLLKEFKSFTLTVHVLPRGDLTGVKWISEFEKIDESVPYPTKLIDFCIAVTKDIETHHLNEAKTE